MVIISRAALQDKIFCMKLHTQRRLSYAPLPPWSSSDPQGYQINALSTDYIKFDPICQTEVVAFKLNLKI